MGLQSLAATALAVHSIGVCAQEGSARPVARQADCLERPSHPPKETVNFEGQHIPQWPMARVACGPTPPL